MILWLRGPAVFKGYYENSEENEKAFTEDGWYRSGDLFSEDRDGNLIFSGQTKNAMKVGGKFVYAQEIEFVANPFPDFAETVAVSMPHHI